MPSSLFVYGTLRHPGIVADPAGRVDGIWYRGLTPGESTRRDHYESDLYGRRPVRVALAHGTEEDAFADVRPPEYESVCADEPWELEHFRPRGEGVLSPLSSPIAVFSKDSRAAPE